MVYRPEGLPVKMKNIMQYHVIKRQVVVEREETYAHFPLFTGSKLRRQFTS